MHAEPPTRVGGHFAALDAARGGLAIVVVFAHAWQNFISTNTPLFLSLSAKLAVFSFFTLSGYVIALNSQRNVEKHGQFDALSYALGRAFRIIPPLVLIIALTALVELALRLGGMNEAPLARAEYRQDLFLTAKCLATLCATGTLVRDANGPLWSLEAEIQLYVLAGLLMVGRKWALIACAVYLAACFRPIRDGLLTIQPVSYFAFAAGWFAQRMKPTGLLIPVGLAAFVGTLSALSATELSHLNGGLGVNLAFACYAIASAAAIPFLATREAPSLLVRAGGFSYTLYIVHFPLLLAGSFIVYHIAPDLIVPAGVVAVPIVIGIAFLIGEFIERPKEQQLLFNRVLTRNRAETEHPS